jgi:putative ATP-binding cassette transporter
MSIFHEELAGSTLLSIAHRPGLDAFHDRTLHLVKSAGGAQLVTKRPRLPTKDPARRRIVPRKLLAAFAGRAALNKS